MMNLRPKSARPAVLILSLFCSLIFTSHILAQEKKEKINAMVHTQLQVSFDYQKRYLYGKEWVTIMPFAHATDSLRLDAKGMEIKSIGIMKNGKNVPLKYTYDQHSLAIRLDRLYQPAEKYTVYIDYTAKPDELKLKAGKVILNDKGLFFINPDSAVKGKPVQIWTQSALENASVWFPTIDWPDQKTTEEISMTVPAKYVTLSNGRLAAQVKNGDGTRTDTWKMELPHSPYLFMMAVGDFKIYKDKWRDKEVSYYLEPQYAPYAKDIFGFTPEMMTYFSTILGVDFPWNKYAQIVVRDYVSGAMENTSATLLINYVQGTKREMEDRYYDEGRSIIAHELMHQWFGDYVTTVDWSNATVNESFADFGETLWAEHYYGQDAGDAHNHEALLEYLSDPESARKPLVRLRYEDPQDAFDLVSYQKGGRILNMLRNYLGAPVFFKGLTIYLKANAFKNADAKKVRVAMEQARGKDLGWFFDQWYDGAGHPLLDIRSEWDEKLKTETVVIAQKQEGKAFVLPMAIDFYIGGKKLRKQVWLKDKVERLSYKLQAKPQLVNVDGDKITLAIKTDHKSLEEFLFQYQHAPLYLDRYEAIEAAAANQTQAVALEIMRAGLQDKYYGLRLKVLTTMDPSVMAGHPAFLPLLVGMAKTDENNLVKAAAITALGKLKNPEAQLAVFEEGLKNRSYAVEAAALTAYALVKPAEALAFARSQEMETGGDLTIALIAVYAQLGGDAEWPFVQRNFTTIDPNKQFTVMKDFVAMTARLKNATYAQQGINTIRDLGISFKQFGMAPQMIEALKQLQQARQALGDEASAQAAGEAIAQINQQS